MYPSGFVRRDEVRSTSIDGIGASGSDADAHGRGNAPSSELRVRDLSRQVKRQELPQTTTKDTSKKRTQARPFLWCTRRGSNPKSTASEAVMLSSYTTGTSIPIILQLRKIGYCLGVLCLQKLCAAQDECAVDGQEDVAA